MKLAKLIFIFLITLFLTGCNAIYELDIGNNIKETINFKENIELIKSFTTIDSYINDTMSYIKSDNNLSIYKYYKISTNTADDLNGIGIRTYDSLLSYKKNSLFYDKLFNDFIINKVGNEITYNFKLNDLSEYFNSNGLYTSFIDNLTIKICLNGNIINGNYNKIDNNCALWYIKDNSINNLNVSYNKDITFVDMSIYIILFIVLIIIFNIVYIIIKNKKIKSC